MGISKSAKGPIRTAIGTANAKETKQVKPTTVWAIANGTKVEILKPTLFMENWGTDIINIVDTNRKNIHMVVALPKNLPNHL